MVLPIAIARDGDRRAAARLDRLALAAAARGQGIPVSLAVTALDALVVARSAFESSMRYRSAVLFGTLPAAVTGASQAGTRWTLLTDALIPGRVAEVRRPNRQGTGRHAGAAADRRGVQLKVAQDWPDDPPSDVAGSAWAGVLPRQLSYPRGLAGAGPARRHRAAGLGPPAARPADCQPTALTRPPDGARRAFRRGTGCAGPAPVRTAR